MLGLFDSGFGGLTVLRKIREKFPALDLGYLGDSARAPYGDKDPATVEKFLRSGVDFLFENGAGMVIVACNTASTAPLRALQKTLPADKKVLGVLVPTAEAAAEFDEVIVIATAATVASGDFPEKIAKLNLRARVRQIATPLLVPLIEEMLHDRSEKFTRRLIAEYLGNLDFGPAGGGNLLSSRGSPPRRTTAAISGETGQIASRRLGSDKSGAEKNSPPPLGRGPGGGSSAEPDFLSKTPTPSPPPEGEGASFPRQALVLGCTHYPVIAAAIRAEVPPGIAILDSATATADRLGDYFSRHPEVAARITRGGNLKIWTTGSPERFAELGGKILGEKISPELAEL